MMILMMFHLLQRREQSFKKSLLNNRILMRNQMMSLLPLKKWQPQLNKLLNQLFKQKSQLNNKFNKMILMKNLMMSLPQKKPVVAAKPAVSKPAV